MATTDKNISKTADILKCLGHPARVEILKLISASRSSRLSVKEVQEGLGITQPEASKHLILMKNLSVLTCERKEGHSYYKINQEHSFIKGIIKHINRK